MWYTIAMKNKSGKVSIGGIGCLVILVAGFFIMRACLNDTRSTLERSQNAQQTNEPSANSLAEPDPTVAETMFRKSLRDYLNDPDSYKPGMLRHGAHPQGYAFIQEFRAKNALGAMIKQSAGLLAATNSGEITWTFYTPEQTPALLREVMQLKAETDPEIKALKNSVDEAKLELSANPAPIIEAATRAIVKEKTTYKSLIFKNLEIRKHAEGRLLIQHFTIDGNHRRLGFLERTPGDFSDIDPNKLKSYIDESTPED